MVLSELLPVAYQAKTRVVSNAVLDLLKSDPLCVELYVRLACQSLSGQELHDAIINIAPSLHADALVSAESEVEGLSSKWKFDTSKLESDLRKSSNANARRLGLAALIAVAKGPDGWSTECRSTLEIYRRDKSVLVATAASFFFSPELEKE